MGLRALGDLAAHGAERGSARRPRRAPQHQAGRSQAAYEAVGLSDGAAATGRRGVGRRPEACGGQGRPRPWEPSDEGDEEGLIGLDLCSRLTLVEATYRFRSTLY